MLPGVGAFGAAMQRLVAAGLVDVLAERVRAGRPLLAICLGLQLLCESSAESPGVRGLGVVPGRVTRFDTGLRVPQLGWNFIKPEPACSLLTSGHAYFANSYRLTDTPAGWSAASAEYGGPFVAAFERGSVLACQFHPELSGRWGLQLLRRWLEIGENSEAAAIGGAASAACLGGAPTSVASSSPASARLSTGAAPC